MILITYLKPFEVGMEFGVDTFIDAVSMHKAQPEMNKFVSLSCKTAIH